MRNPSHMENHKKCIFSHTMDLWVEVFATYMYIDLEYGCLLGDLC